jgi:uncharacterized membrane protein YhaH (DUF805 family)
VRFAAVFRRWQLFALSPHGRITRTAYFFGVQIVVILCGLLIDVFAAALGLSPVYGLGGRITLSGGILLMSWPISALSIKRAHDLGVTGFAVLLILIPFFGWVPQLILLFARGPERPVRYWRFRTVHG